ncbi:MAG: tetratricopeptide repeat protein [Bacteroidota bacterium]
MKFSTNNIIVFLFLWLVSSFVSVAKTQENNYLKEVTSADEHFTQAANFLFQGLLDQSISSFVSAENEYRKSKNEQQIIACYLGLATCYSLKGDFKKSLKFNEKALSLHKKSRKDDKEGLDLILSNIALCKQAQQNK